MREKKRMNLGNYLQEMKRKRRERKKEQEKQNWSQDTIAEREPAKEVKSEEENARKVSTSKISHGKNQWKASKTLRIIVTLGLCVALVTGAFSGVKMVGTVRQMWDMDVYSSDSAFEASEGFNYLLDEYLQLFELYLDISQVIAPDGKLNYDTVLLEGEDKNYTLEELYQAEGNGYDYQYYVDNYIDNMLEYSDNSISLLQLTQEIRSLRKMAVINNGKLYFTSRYAKELSSKKKKELLRKASENHVKIFNDKKTLLPAFESGDGDFVGEIVKLSIPEKGAEIESKSEYQDWIIKNYPEYAKGYMLLQIADAYEQGFVGELESVEAKRYQRIFSNLYDGECFLSYAYEFYEYEGEEEVTYVDYYTGEEHHIAKEQIVYNKKGKETYAKDVRDAFGHNAYVYSMSQPEYAKKLRDEAQEIMSKLPKEEIPWSAPVLPYTLEAAQDYADFLVEFYEGLHELFRSGRFDCYFEAGDRILKSNEGWSYLIRRIEKMQSEKSEKNENNVIYAYYNSNGSVFDTNLENTYFCKSDECYEFLERIGKEYGKSDNYICAFMVDLKKIDSAYQDEHFAKLYEIYEGDTQIYADLEKEAKQAAVYFGISLLGIFLTMIILSMMSGHEKDSNVVVLKWYDKIWLEIVIILFFTIFGGFLALCWEGTYWYAYSEPVREPEIFQAIVWGLAVLAAMMAGILLSVIKREKAKTLLKSSVICSNVYRLKHSAGKVVQHLRKWMEYVREFPILIRYIAVIGVNLTGGFIFFVYIADGSMGYSFFLDLFMFLIVVGLIVLDVFGLRVIMKNAIADEKIREGAARIAGGELSYQIEAPNGISKEQRELVKVINSIGEGLEKAVEESVRSERMKTELITNVSHDIKTPLTSVINYVDLLKRENIESERAQEYLKILEQKSQRLKVLIDDLVEASKASSGAMELQISKLNFNELVHQTDGEFEEKFQEAGLNLVSSVSEDIIVFKGDGRRVYRILENLYGNVAKYAMPGTRVYTELYQNQNKAVFTIKNISREPLNISSKELTERFVRGEQSRTTEGSGLGLSIAKSLTELMDGSFEIHMDGDLFRVTISFPVA